MRIAITHDWLISLGGAENVLAALLEIFPKADVYTTIFDKTKFPSDFYRNVNVYTSFLQKLPFASKHYRNFVVLMPYAFRSFNFSKYDLVISNSHACAKDINIPKNSLHICYCLTPMRYIWDMYDDYMKMEKPNLFVKLFAPLAAQYLRRRDIDSSKSVNEFIAISNFVSQRIRKYYGRESIVIYPPVDTHKYYVSPQTDDYYVVVSRLVPQKRTDFIIRAFNKLKKPLKIVGKGRHETELKQIAKSNVQFLGFVNDEEKSKILSRAKALIFASVEDFGIVPVEAMASGRPVIAYSKGGVLDTVIPNQTGLFFDEMSDDAIIDAVLKFEKMEFNSQKIKDHAEKFSKRIFIEKMKDFVLGKVQGKNYL